MRISDWSSDVCSSDLEVNRNPIGDGVTIGKIFRKKGSNPKSPSGMRQNARSSEELISNFWGSYVHVADGPTGVVILRDPSGGLPCYQVAGTGLDRKSTRLNSSH